MFGLGERPRHVAEVADVDVGHPNDTDSSILTVDDDEKFTREFEWLVGVVVHQSRGGAFLTSEDQRVESVAHLARGTELEHSHTVDHGEGHTTILAGPRRSRDVGLVTDNDGVMRKQYNFWPSAHGFDAWDVDRLVSLSSGIPVTLVALDEIEDVDTNYWFTTDAPSVRLVVIHMDLIDAVEIRYPIILASSGRVMDGMHRIARALRDGRDSIPAVRFREDPEPDFHDVQPDDLPY